MTTRYHQAKDPAYACQSRANHTTDQAKLPIIVRIGLCGHRRLRKPGATQAAATPRRATRKAERRTSRRSGL